MLCMNYSIKLHFVQNLLSYSIMLMNASYTQPEGKFPNVSFNAIIICRHGQYSSLSSL